MGYWIKLYTDILDDPKYFRLSEKAKLGMYELMLVAKKVENGTITGDLPSLDDIAFHTRKSREDWEAILPELEDIGFIENKADAPVIRNYIKRQEAIPVNTRVKQSRKKRNDTVMNNVTDMKRECNDTVTNRNGEEEKNKKQKQNTETEEEKDKNIYSPASFISEFVSAVRVQFTNHDQPQTIKDLVDDYGEDVVLQAATWYGQNNPRNMGHALKSINTALSGGWNTSRRKETVEENNQRVIDAFLKSEEVIVNGN